MNTGALVAIWGGLITLALVAVLVSQKAQTSSVLQAISSGGASLLNAATAPVTGGSSSSATGS